MENKIKQLLEKEHYNISDLAEIVTILRSENGCPWDKVQTHKSIKKDFLEEVYEVMEAIDCDSPEMMREELGDVLLQVVFHTVIETEQNNFGLDEVTDDICKKLIVRHPHVFGSVDADNVEQVLKNWDSIKKETKGQESYTDTLKSVPKNFPSLMRAQKLGKRSYRAREDYESNQDGQLKAWEQISSECSNLHEMIECGSDEEQKQAFGDLLFVCCNMARTMGIDAEEALSEANERYIGRFERAEELARQKGQEMSALGIDELDVLWREADK